MKENWLSSLATVLLLSTINCPQTFAWNNYGHMAVASVAYHDLTPETKTRIKTLLKLNPYYKELWPADFPDEVADDDEELMFYFMRAATWPDQIKSTESHRSSTRTRKAKAHGNNANAVFGYNDPNIHRNWHYINVPIAVENVTLPSIPRPNVQTQIAKCREVLASDASDKEKSYALVWLLHLVGDIHQPLHAVARIAAGENDDDKGGLDVSILPNENLHSTWDSALHQDEHPNEMLADAAVYATRLPKPEDGAVNQLDVQKWIDESVALAKSNVYVAPVGTDNGPFSLDRDYYKQAHKIAKSQVSLAGHRLAKILNTELK